MSGHLRKRGTSWELRAYAGLDPITKRQTYVTRTFRGGKREAQDALARLVAEVSGGGHASQDTTFGDLFRDWLDLAKPELSPTTARGYEWIGAKYILPSLGDVPLSKLKTAQLDRFYAKLRNAGGRNQAPLSPATVRQVHAIVRRALHQGVKWGWIVTNPAALASPPRSRASRLSPPDPPSVLQLIAAAFDDDADFGCFLYLSASTGARRGELCALRWRDIDFDGRTITISHNVVEGPSSALIDKDTKTHGIRKIAIDTGTTQELVDHQQRMTARAMACGIILSRDAHLFSPDPDGVRPWVPNEVTKRFIRIRRRIGLEQVRLHDFRHFAATRLLAAGVPVRTVSGRLGHANAATTLGVYAHFVEETDREAADALGALLIDGGRASRQPERSNVIPARTRARSS